MKSWMKYTIAGYVIYNLIRSRDEKVTYIEPLPERIAPREEQRGILNCIIFSLFLVAYGIAIYFFLIKTILKLF